MWYGVDPVLTEVSEERVASILKMEIIRNLGQS
jgi:hypothetical protein